MIPLHFYAKSKAIFYMSVNLKAVVSLSARPAYGRDFKISQCG